MMILAAILWWAAAPAVAVGERIAAPPLPDFVIGYEARDPNYDMAISEEVPAGQNVQEWTRMVTTQRMGGLAARVSVQAFLQAMADGLPASCPGAATSPVKTSVVGGRAAARMEVACPRLASTGKPETFLILAIAGPRDIHVKQVAFRGGHRPADVVWARGFLDRVSFCAADNRRGVCAD
jgi:hypothetical protein